MPSMVARLARLALILPLACASVPRAPDEGGPTWSRGDGAHLYVETDLGASGARELTHDLELWRLAMTAALFERARAPTENLQVIALRIGELASLNPSLLGVFGRGSKDDDPTLVLGPDQPDQRTEIMRHELAHAVVSENLNGVPRWLNEGLASLLATAEFDEKTGVVSWGRLEIHNVHISHYDLAPLDKVLDDAWPGYDLGRYEFSSAYVVRMLALEYPAELKCLLERLTGTGGYDAAEEACFSDTDAWEAKYVREQFRENPIVGRVELRARPNDKAVTVRSMSDVEVHETLARLSEVVASTPMNGERRTELNALAEKHRERVRALGGRVPERAAAPGAMCRATRTSCYLGTKAAPDAPPSEGLDPPPPPSPSEKADIQRVIRSHQEKVRACYEDRLRVAHPTGVITIQFAIGADGQVKWSRLESSTANDPVLETSVGALSCDWQFAKPTGVAEVRVTYPFTFLSAPP